MAAPTLEIEVRWRPVGTTGWRIQRYPPTANTITLTGLQRGKTYEGQACSIGPGDLRSAWVPINFVVASQSSTPLDQITIDLDIEGNKVVVDCTLSRFRLTLNDHVKVWQFANVPTSKTITIEIEQWSPGNHTVTWPASVVPVSGRAHVMTPTTGAVDIITLSTSDGGTTWRQTVGQPEPGSGGGSALGVTISPNPASASVNVSGTAVAPSVALTTTVANSTEPSTVAWVRTDTNGGENFTISDAASKTPTLSIPADLTAYNATQTWRCTVTDAGNATASASVPVTLSRRTAGGMTVEISPNPASATGYDDPPSVTVTAYVSGGSGARSFSWTRVDANGGANFSVTDGATAQPTFTKPGPSTGLRTQTWRCTVSDDTGPSSADVDIALERINSNL